ncbi:MAG: hypothetical protein AB1626_04960 [Candidatus Micrarchaeota archaeon]
MTEPRKPLEARVLERLEAGEYTIGRIRGAADGLRPAAREHFLTGLVGLPDVPERIKRGICFLLGRHYVEQKKPALARDSFIRSEDYGEGAKILARAGFHKEAADLHFSASNFYEAAHHYRKAGLERHANEMLRLAEEARRTK